MTDLSEIRTEDLLDELGDRITRRMDVDNIESHGHSIFCVSTAAQKQTPTDCGLYVVNKEHTREMVYLVLSVGPGTVSSPIVDVEENDIVVAGRGSGHDVQIQGDEYVLLPHKDILGIVKPDSIDLDNYTQES